MEKEANKGRSTNTILFTNPLQIPVGKGVRQVDPLSPKLFSVCLEMVFHKLNCERGLNVNGVWLNHLLFADEQFSPRSVHEML